jgi:glycerophosphoryl diester phosphodiesterase
MGKRSTAPLVLGHRGDRARFPENTLLSFRMALAAGAHGIECDVQKTADGRFVVIHDADTARVCGIPRPVGSSSFDELRGLDAGAGERIPELSEVLSALPPGCFLDLELKRETLSPADCEPIRGILQGRVDPRRLMISSFDPRLIAPFRRRGFIVGFLAGRDAAAMGVGALALLLLRLRPQYLNLPVEVLRAGRPRLVRLVFRVLRLLGFSLLFWTINTEADAEEAARSARILVTDDVERLVGWRDQVTGRFPAG